RAVCKTQSSKPNSKNLRHVPSQTRQSWLGNWLSCEQGWAALNNEWDADMTAGAVSLQGANGAIIAALTIAGCTHDLPPESFAEQSRALHTAVRLDGQLLE